MEEKNIIEFEYKNWVGEVGIRKAKLIKYWYGKTEFHTEYQWFMKAIDIDKNKERDFAIKDIIKII